MVWRQGENIRITQKLHKKRSFDNHYLWWNLLGNVRRDPSWTKVPPIRPKPPLPHFPNWCWKFCSSSPSLCLFQFEYGLWVFALLALHYWRLTGKVAPVQRRLTLPFVDRFPAWLQKSSPGSGSWELDYAFRSLSRILFIFRRVMFDDAFRREYSDQSKAILWALEFTIESAHPPSLCSRSKISSPWSLFC